MSVTGDCCRGGEVSGGYESRRAAHSKSPGSDITRARFGEFCGERRRVGGAGNAANPMAGFGMQQARGSECGASRRRGERPHGRNASVGGYRQTEGTRQRVLGADTPRSTGGGESRRITEEESWQQLSLDGESLRESEGHAGCGPGARARMLASVLTPWGGGRRESLEGQSGDGERPRRMWERPTTHSPADADHR